MAVSLYESIVEDAAQTWFGELGYAVGHGPHLAPAEPAEERDSFGAVVLARRLREAIRPAFDSFATGSVGLCPVLRTVCLGRPACLPRLIVFEEDPDSGALHKIIAGYHQFHAVNAAVEETLRAVSYTHLTLPTTPYV